MTSLVIAHQPVVWMRNYAASNMMLRCRNNNCSFIADHILNLWRIQKSLVEGDVVEAGWGGVPPPHGGGVWGGVCAPSPEIFFNFGPHNGQFRCTVGAGGGDASHSSSPPGSATVLNISLLEFLPSFANFWVCCLCFLYLILFHMMNFNYAKHEVCWIFYAVFGILLTTPCLNKNCAN